MKLPIFNTLLLIAILAYLIVGSINTKSDNKQAYIVTGELFAQFDYQKELDAEYKIVKESEEKKLTNLKNNLIVLENKIRSEVATDEEFLEYQQGLFEFQNLEHQINEALSAITSEYNIMIWNKLNAFVKEYGEENGYDVILGAVGNGNIMYASDDKNVTLEVIEFCNKKYNGQQ